MRTTPALAALAAGALALGACNRESRDLQPTPTVETGPHAVSVSDLYPGPIPSPTPDDPRAQAYEGNALHIANGQRYFQWFNCVGCRPWLGVRRWPASPSSPC